MERWMNGGIAAEVVPSDDSGTSEVGLFLGSSVGNVGEMEKLEIPNTGLA